MTQTLEATFDGKTILPDEPIDLQPNTRLRIVIEIIPDEPQSPVSFLRAARALELDGPPDWSDNLDDYLCDENSR